MTKTRMLCFLIDDDEDDQEIFALALADVDPNLQCVCASSGWEALKKLKEDESFLPDYIFIDLNMPRMNGKECLLEIKKIDRVKNVPVVVYSTSSEAKDLFETRELGALDYITKPSSISALTKTLAGFFRNRMPSPR